MRRCNGEKAGKLSGVREIDKQQWLFVSEQQRLASLYTHNHCVRGKGCFYIMLKKDEHIFTDPGSQFARQITSHVSHINEGWLLLS
jgi:hypothetical protein